ncbi:MAG: peptidoglycan-binding protein [Planctomycetes bacterium]|nr:peptidoglycan-binding protein [Planctomycetota bacterium]
MAFTSPRFASNARLQQAAENNPALKAGETSEAVRILQMALVDLGFPMPISTHNGSKLPDGIFGAETTKTVQAFQRANGLVVDGIAGRNTLAKLEILTIAATERQAQVDALQSRQRSVLS